MRPLARRERLALRNLVLACAGQDLAAGGDRLQGLVREFPLELWNGFGQVCDLHGLAPQAYAVLAEFPSIPAPVLVDLQRRTLAHAGTHLRTLTALRDLAPIFEETAGDWLVLKGPVLRDHTYRIPGRRVYGDLDVYVAAESVGRTLEALERAGAMLISRNWNWLTKHARNEIQLRLPGKVTLDLHWDLIGSFEHIREPLLSSVLMAGRAREVMVGRGSNISLSVPTLDPIDTLIHLSVHSVLASMGPLRLVVDIDQAWRRQQDKTAELISRSHAMGAGLAVAVALHRAAVSIGTPIPAGLTSILAGPRSSGWRRAMVILERVSPPQAAHEGLVLNGFRGATRSSTWSSVQALPFWIEPWLLALAQPRNACMKISRKLYGLPPDLTRSMEEQQRAAGDREKFFESIQEGSH